jgi:hypothetical protein
MISRRRFLQTLTAGTAAAAGAGLYTWQVEPHWLEIVRCTCPLRTCRTLCKVRRPRSSVTSMWAVEWLINVRPEVTVVELQAL